MQTLEDFIREETAASPTFAVQLNEAEAAVDLALALGRIRKHRKLTQRALADRTGIKQPQIARIERGSHVPSVTTLARLADALGMSIRIGPGNGGAITISAEELSECEPSGQPSFGSRPKVAA